MEALNLSPIGLFLAAGLVGKFVMGVLFLASLWCWVLIIEGVISVVRLGRAVRAARAGEAIAKPLEAIATAGDEEARRRISGETVGELRERISDAMARAARELLTRSEGGLPNLAVISSVAEATDWTLSDASSEASATTVESCWVVSAVLVKAWAAASSLAEDDDTVLMMLPTAFSKASASRRTAALR